MQNKLEEKYQRISDIRAVLTNKAKEEIKSNKIGLETLYKDLGNHKGQHIKGVESSALDYC